jgi:hypothetical protein
MRLQWAQGVTVEQTTRSTERLAPVPMNWRNGADTFAHGWLNTSFSLAIAGSQTRSAQRERTLLSVTLPSTTDCAASASAEPAGPWRAPVALCRQRRDICPTQTRGDRMADNRGVAYMGPGKVEVHN